MLQRPAQNLSATIWKVIVSIYNIIIIIIIWAHHHLNHHHVIYSDTFTVIL